MRVAAEPLDAATLHRSCLHGVAVAINVLSHWIRPFLQLSTIVPLPKACPDYLARPSASNPAVGCRRNGLGLLSAIRFSGGEETDIKPDLVAKGFQ